MPPPMLTFVAFMQHAKYRFFSIGPTLLNKQRLFLTSAKHQRPINKSEARRSINVLPLYSN